MASSQKYTRRFRKSLLERTSVLLLLATLTGIVGGGAVGLITGHTQSTATSSSSGLSSSPSHH